MNQRYYSLDVFRGATVAFMILVNNPGSWAYVYPPLDHAEWHGCTPTDLVFPFFLFAVGNALAFVMPRLREQGDACFLRKIVKRTLLIFLIGLFLNWCPFVRWQDGRLVAKAWDHVRIFGVLQRIALCYFFASVITYYMKPKPAVATGLTMLLLYWLLCSFLGAPGNPYSLPGFFGAALDKALLGPDHMYHGEGVAFDPEGIASTLPAIVQVIIGYLTGKYIRERGKTWEMLGHLLLAGVLLVAVGFCWDMVFPINKKIWTSSYVLYAGGLSLMALGVFIYLLEFRQARGAWSSFFNVFGKNSLFIFFISGFLPRVFDLFHWVASRAADGKPVYMTPFSWWYTHVCNPVFSNPKNGSLLYAITLVLFYWLVGYVLDRKNIYIKV